jgi:hypothetical protein
MSVPVMEPEVLEKIMGATPSGQPAGGLRPEPRAGSQPKALIGRIVEDAVVIAVITLFVALAVFS